jgi:hypothetical protein
LRDGDLGGSRKKLSRHVERVPSQHQHQELRTVAGSGPAAGIDNNSRRKKDDERRATNCCCGFSNGGTKRA